MQAEQNWQRIDPPHLPPLVVMIYKGRELVHVAEVPDPREVFIQEFNKQAESLGLRAKL